MSYAYKKQSEFLDNIDRAEHFTCPACDHNQTAYEALTTADWDRDYFCRECNTGIWFEMDFFGNRTARLVK